MVAHHFDPMLPELYRVEHVHRETKDTYTLKLARTSHSTNATTAFSPGQFNMLYAFGLGEVPISISGDPARCDQVLVHTIRAVGAVTNAICRMRKGDMLGVRGPYGVPWPLREAEGGDVVLAAGGLGMAPLRPALYHILSNRHLYGQVSLVYGARSPDDLLYRHELEKWRGRFDLQVEITVDRAGPEWHGSVGTTTSLMPRVRFDPLRTMAMVCGPEIMMHFTVQELQRCGVSTEQIFVSMERNMKCGVGFCGHCQFGPVFICRDGPVFPYQRIRALLGKREV